MDNSVRPTIFPMLINYIQGRNDFVKWKEQHFETKPITGCGPQGGFMAF